MFDVQKAANSIKFATFCLYLCFIFQLVGTCTQSFKTPFRTAVKKNEFRDLFNVYTIKDMEVRCGLVKTKEERENFELWKGSNF